MVRVIAAIVLCGACSSQGPSGPKGDFAALWYAHLVAANTPEVGNPPDLLEAYERGFDELVAKREDSAAPEDTLQGVVDEFLLH